MKPKVIARRVLGVVFILAGLNHFRRPGMYQATMPDYLPWHRRLVELSGYAEVALGGAVLAKPWAAWAGRGLIALLVAVFPANLHMALHARRYRPIPAWALWARLPLQPLLIGVVHWCTGAGGDRAGVFYRVLPG